MRLVEAVLQSAERAAQFNQNYEAGPVCVLWPDKDRLWEPLAPAFRESFRNFLQLGDFAPENRTGPALWLKCALAGLLPGVTIESEKPPILYLPGVSRSDLRDAEACAPALQPLIELQHRGTIWSHPNGKDWTTTAYLSSSEGGLGLDVARDQQTSIALQQALTKLGDLNVSQLYDQRLDSDFLLALLHPDPERQLLRWLDASKRFRAALGDEEWSSFATVCRGTYRFDPEKDGELAAAELLAARKGPWKQIWIRFKEAPQHYPGIPQWLRRACPAKQMELALEERVYRRGVRALATGKRKCGERSTGRSQRTAEQTAKGDSSNDTLLGKPTSTESKLGLG